MKIRELAANIGLATISLLTFLLLAELFLQFVIPIFYRPRFTKLDPVLGWYHNASVSHAGVIERHRFQLSYNSHGFRAPEHEYGKSAGTLRVLFLGDSFTDGSEVDDQETFTWRLENCLRGIEVINLGVYGYSTAQELLVFERFGIRYKPDLVVLLTVTNDFIGNVMALESFGPAPRFMPDGDSLRLEGTDHRAAKAAFRATNLPAPAIVHRNSLVHYLLNKYVYQRLIADRIVQVRRARAAELDHSERLELYRKLASRIKSRSNEIGADFVVVFGYQKSELANGGASPNRELIAALHGEQVNTIDLFDGLVANERDGDSLYYREDIHWNTAGHAVVTSLLMPMIESWQRGESWAEVKPAPTDGSKCDSMQERNDSGRTATSR